MASSAIEWTEATWNPTTGCDSVSPGCDRCYAMTMAKRLKAMGQPKYQADGSERTSGPGFALTLHEDAISLPTRWRAPRMIFVNSMSDLFHPDVPTEFVREIFGVIEATPQHTYQVLTKRSKRLASVAPHLQWPANLWIGVSIESEQYLYRADHLREIPAAVRFLSLEPLLGPIPLNDLEKIDWVIVGGESGGNARALNAQWVRDIRDACIKSETAFFFKQWGGRTPKAHGRELDGCTWSEFPANAGGQRRLTPALTSRLP